MSQEEGDGGIDCLAISEDTPESLRAEPTHCDTYTDSVVELKMASKGTLKRQY